MSCLLALSVTVGAVGIAGAAGCASTEYVNEGPGQPTPRASGSLPPGSQGACKEPFTKRPPIVSEELWAHTKLCTARTPASFIRLGYAKDGSAGADPEAEQLAERVLAALAEGARPEGGNNQVMSAIRAVRAYAVRKDELRARIARESPAEQACDVSYLLNTMSAARSKLEGGDACTAEVFDPETRADVCLFDAKRPEGLWLSSGWSCMTFTGALGNEASCHQLCGYDDYCARQVYCATGDINLLLCALGVCLPEPSAGVR
ncbi:hypothetical protein SOCE26_043590 [Sorangium cellulosum]|uniref:Secreted protein n=1 Tax=Sorangium cellulosum TaxID=56 RepID=A0A2L0EUG6_SORCE|nr:hypothetical protein [Sorangium cellulosum]AUX42919.1 hypothetical protein SOCE26_043590 [Sorangium cellulosum]